MARSTVESARGASRSSSGGVSRRPRRRAGGLTTLATGALAAAALLAPASAFLPAGVGSCGAASAVARRARPQQQQQQQQQQHGWGATTMHNSEGAFSGGGNNGGVGAQSPSSAPLKAEAAGQGQDDLQHALFKDDKRRVILFDGDCGFCSEGVNLFLNMDGDPRGSFRFASLQGDVGQELLRLNGMDQKVFNTIVLVDAERIYTKSDAVLEIADKLRDPFPVLANLAKLLPHEARDWAYELVSRYRHLFGEKDSCRIPSEEEMDRFLD